MADEKKPPEFPSEEDMLEHKRELAETRRHYEPMQHHSISANDRDSLADEFESIKDNQPFRITNRARALIVDLLRLGGTTYKVECAARNQNTAGGNDPAECDWPVCGCDPYADRVIAALQESGILWNRRALSPAPGEVGTLTNDEYIKLTRLADNIIDQLHDRFDLTRSAKEMLMLAEGFKALSTARHPQELVEAANELIREFEQIYDGPESPISCIVAEIVRLRQALSTYAATNKYQGEK